MAEKQLKSSKLKPDHFMVWLTLPKTLRAELRAAAGSLEMSMSEFARLAVLRALAQVQAGKNPFKSRKSV